MYAFLTWWLSSFSVTIFSRIKVLCVTTDTALVWLPICNWPILMFPSFDYGFGFLKCLPVHLKASCTICMISFLFKNIKMIFGVLHVITDDRAKFNLNIDVMKIIFYFIWPLTCTSSFHKWIHIQNYLKSSGVIVFSLHSGMKYILNIWQFSFLRNL